MKRSFPCEEPSDAADCCCCRWAVAVLTMNWWASFSITHRTAFADCKSLRPDRLNSRTTNATSSASLREVTLSSRKKRG